MSLLVAVSVAATGTLAAAEASVPLSLRDTSAHLRSELAAAFRHEGPSPPSTEATLHLHLRQSSPEIVHEAARSVSDPASPRFRRFFGPDEIVDWLRPSNEHRAAVEATVAQWRADAATDACAAEVGAPCEIRVRWHDDHVVIHGTAAALYHATGARLHAYQHTIRRNVRRDALVGSLRVAPGAEQAIELVTGAPMLLDPSMLRTPTRERANIPSDAAQAGETVGTTVPMGQERLTATGKVQCYDNAAGVAPTECEATNTCWNTGSTVSCCPRGKVGVGGKCRPGGSSYSDKQSYPDLADKAAGQYVTPRVVRERMHVPHAHGAVSPPERAPVTMGIVAFNDFFSNRSLAKGMGLLDETPAESIMLMCRDPDNSDSMINGVNRFEECGKCVDAKPPCDQTESTLDVQYIQSTGTGIPIWFWMMGANDWVLNWANSVKDALATPEKFKWALPRIFSMSYGVFLCTRARTQLGPGPPTRGACTWEQPCCASRAHPDDPLLPCPPPARRQGLRSRCSVFILIRTTFPARRPR